MKELELIFSIITDKNINKIYKKLGIACGEKFIFQGKVCCLHFTGAICYLDDNGKWQPSLLSILNLLDLEDLKE